MLDVVGLRCSAWAERPAIAAASDVSDTLFKCTDCLKAFDTLQKLQVQRSSVHNVFAAAAQWITTNGVCLDCMKLFHTKLCLDHHLQHTYAGISICQPSIAAWYPPINVPVSTKDCVKKSGARSCDAVRFTDCEQPRAPLIRMCGPLIPQLEAAAPLPIAPDVGCQHAPGL